MKKILAIALIALAAPFVLRGLGRFKSTQDFDSTVHREQHKLG